MIEQNTDTEMQLWEVGRITNLSPVEKGKVEIYAVRRRLQGGGKIAEWHSYHTPWWRRRCGYDWRLLDIVVGNGMEIFARVAVAAKSRVDEVKAKGSIGNRRDLLLFEGIVPASFGLVVLNALNVSFPICWCVLE